MARTLAQVDQAVELLEQTMARMIQKQAGFATRVEQEQLTGIYQMRDQTIMERLERLESMLTVLIEGSR